MRDHADAGIVIHSRHMCVFARTMTTSERWSAALRMVEASDSSSKKVERPSCRLSLAPMRVKMARKTVSCAKAAGTNEPTCSGSSSWCV